MNRHKKLFSNFNPSWCYSTVYVAKKLRKCGIQVNNEVRGQLGQYIFTDQESASGAVTFDISKTNLL